MCVVEDKRRAAVEAEDYLLAGQFDKEKKDLEPARMGSTNNQA